MGWDAYVLGGECLSGGVRARIVEARRNARLVRARLRHLAPHQQQHNQLKGVCSLLYASGSSLQNLGFCELQFRVPPVVQREYKSNGRNRQAT